MLCKSCLRGHQDHFAPEAYLRTGAAADDLSGRSDLSDRSLGGMLHVMGYPKVLQRLCLLCVQAVTQRCIKAGALTDLCASVPQPLGSKNAIVADCVVPSMLKKTMQQIKMNRETEGRSVCYKSRRSVHDS